MKKLIFFLFIIGILLSSCKPSNEERAKDMAATYLKGVLYHFDSYEPLTTTVDSLFVSVSTDEETIGMTLEFLKMFEAANEYAEKIQDAEMEMEIWSPRGFSSDYGRGKYNQAKNDKEQQEKRLDKLTYKLKAQFEAIKKNQASLKTGEFSGWKVYQKFKSLNGPGTLVLFEEYIFLCDKNFENCQGYEKNEYEMLSKFMQAIDKSETISDLQDNLMDIAY